MSWLYANGKRGAYVLALLVVFCPMKLAAQSGGEAASIVRVGDIVFAIPAALKPALVPSGADAKARFDYSKIDSKGGPSGVRNADSVFIKLENLWPLSQRQRGAVLAIRATAQAAEIDLFCRSKSRIGRRPDPSKAVRTDGQFYVFEEPLTAGPVYMARGDFRMFGAPVTAWRSESPLIKQLHPGGEEEFRFGVALSNNTELTLTTSEFRIPRETLPAFLASVERQIRSWIVFPDPASFRWFHERDKPC
jgi:hypothetical protein